MCQVYQAPVWLARKVLVALVVARPATTMRLVEAAGKSPSGKTTRLLET
jgi:hypothetical protein